MSDIKESAKSIVLNLVSNIIFQIALMVFSGSGISYILLEKLNYLQNNVLTISLFHVVILCICIIIFIIAFFCPFPENAFSSFENFAFGGILYPLFY